MPSLSHVVGHESPSVPMYNSFENETFLWNFVDCGNGGGGVTARWARNPDTTLIGPEAFARIGTIPSLSEQINAAVSYENAAQFQSRQQSEEQSLVVLFAGIVTFSNASMGCRTVPGGSSVTAASHALSTRGGGCGPGTKPLGVGFGGDGGAGGLRR